jgi:hypothetical protein
MGRRRERTGKDEKGRERGTGGGGLVKGEGRGQE